MIKYTTEYAENLDVLLLRIEDHEFRQSFVASNGIGISFSPLERTQYNSKNTILTIRKGATLVFEDKYEFDSVVGAIVEYNQHKPETELDIEKIKQEFPQVKHCELIDYNRFVGFVYKNRIIDKYSITDAPIDPKDRTPLVLAFAKQEGKK